MRHSAFLSSAALAGALLLSGCDAVQTSAPTPPAEAGAPDASSGRIVVANRDDGTLSVIDVETNAVTTVAMPDGGEPMYVVYTPAQDRVFVGDRANSRVVAFDAQTFEVEGVVPTGAGVFHMWAEPRLGQLWVVGDVDNTLTVVDPQALTVLATIPVTGGQPHDTVVSLRGTVAFASVFVDGGTDQVVQYSTSTFEELGRVDVGEDPHLSLSRGGGDLYVPAQNSDVVDVFDRLTLAPVASLSVPGAHGAAMATGGGVFYTTNLPGAGAHGLFAIDTETNTVLGSVDTPVAVPHNIATTPDNARLYVTHSGPNTEVTVYTTSPGNPVPVFAATVTVGLNPFGLTYVP